MQGKIYDCSDEQQRAEGIALATKAAKSGHRDPNGHGVRTWL